MNRKKISLLLTGLLITSSIFTGCMSSNNGNTTSDNGANTAQNDSIFKRASERIVTDFNEQIPMDYQNNTIDSYEQNSLRNGFSTPDLENQFNNTQNFDNNTNLTDNGLGYDSGITQDYQMTPSNDEIIDFGNSSNYSQGSQMPYNETQNFENSSNQIGGFSNVITDDYNMDSQNYNSGSNASSNSTNNLGEQTPNNFNNENLNSSSTGESRNVQAKGNIAGKAQVDETKLAGQISVVNVKGSSEITGGKPQGVAEISFKLSGDVLKATHSSTALSTLLQNAYEETRKDANTGYTGAATTTEREKLQAALAAIFSPSDTTFKMIFKSTNNEVKIVPFASTNMFPDVATAPDYVRHIIDLDSTSGQSAKNARNSRSTNASDVVIKMMIRVDAPDGSKELKTNTEYSFVGTEGDANVKIQAVDTTKDQLVGFTVPNFKTGKIPSKIGATDSSGSVIYEGESSTTQGTQKNDLYANQITNNTYVDMKKLIDGTQVTSTGTSLRFKSIIFNDTDKTITKVELEDDRGNKYPATLTSVDSSDASKGSYLEVNNLKRDTPYIFTKINVTSKVNTESETKTIFFANFDGGNLTINNLPIRTTAFSSPQLSLGANHDAKVKLPSGLEVQSVKNDSTALRYIFKVDNPEGFIGDIRVNGLRSGEESKIEKIVDEKAKINYYVVTISKLSKNTDYGFLIIEVDYKDPEGNQQVGRQALGDINKDGTGITDNKTESNALTGTNAFNVILNESVTASNARSIEVPVFIDDLHGKFVRIEFTAPKDNANAKVTYEDNKLKFTDLNPESNTVCKVDFVYKNADDKEEKLSKYVKISTPKVEDLDIKSSTVTPDATTAEITFDFYSEPKSKVKTVVVKDSQEKEIKSSWDASTRTLRLEGLTEKTEYSNLISTFTLENGKTVKYTIGTFKTKEAEVKPTGKVAEFVERVYKIALGRNPEGEGWNYWIQKLESKELTATEFIAENLMTQSEFVDRELSKKTFVTTMYSLIVNREPDAEGQKYWEGKYDEYRNGITSIEDLRIKIAREMMGQSEFRELVGNLNLQY